jgi:hypothetical protein
VAYTADSGAPDDAHVFRQVQGGSPQQVDSCPAAAAATCLTDFDGDQIGMSDDGNLITYAGLGRDETVDGWDLGTAGRVYVYNAATGQVSDPYPPVITITGNPAVSGTVTLVTLDDPIISGDGSTIAMAEDLSFGIWDEGLPLEGSDTTGITVARVSGGNVTQAADITLADSDEGDQTCNDQLQLDDGGSSLLYTLATACYTTDSFGPLTSLNVEKNGASTSAPWLGGYIVNSASMAGDGATIVYTLLNQAGFNPDAPNNTYPGVYAWHPGG